MDVLGCSVPFVDRNGVGRVVATRILCMKREIGFLGSVIWSMTLLLMILIKVVDFVQELS